MYKRMMIAAAVATGVAFAPAAAQQQTGLVNVVLLEDVDVDLNRVISENNINVSVPVTANIQVPIGIAANLCNTTVALLAQEVRQGSADCDATQESASDAELLAVARTLQRQ